MLTAGGVHMSKAYKMFSDALLPEPKFILEIENPPKLVEINLKDDIFFSDKYTQEKRIRAYIYQMLLEAKAFLPKGYYFKIYEAFRPLQAQKNLWDQVVLQQKKAHPELDETSEEFIALCDKYCANPYRQGSGHQSGAAIDITLCDAQQRDYDMGGIVRGFSDDADFNYPVSEEARKNRIILRSALEQVGFKNYPSEWWHYSFGDRLWARLKGEPIAFFKKLEQ